MNDVLTFVHDAEPLKAIEAHVEGITLLIQQVTECGYFVADYMRPDFCQSLSVFECSLLIPYVGAGMEEYAILYIDSVAPNYKCKLRELKDAFLKAVTLQTGITVVRSMKLTAYDGRVLTRAGWSQVHDTEETIDLDDLPYALGAGYAEEKGCLAGTRGSVLNEIRDILNNPAEDAPRVCLLTGVAGSGKSTVAHSIARLYDGQKRLGSSYFFSSSDVAKRNPQNLFGTIPRNLCEHDPQYKSALERVRENLQTLRIWTTPWDQVERLIVKPSANLHPIGPLVIVIDALDESGSADDRVQLLNTLSSHIAGRKLPTNLRFLITTRLENDILNAFSPNLPVVRVHLGDVPEAMIAGDIESFFYHSLHHHPELDSSWPNREWCRLLTERSQHLFQWASTACKFITGSTGTGLDLCHCLRVVLESNNSEGVYSLDRLYRTILEQNFEAYGVQRRFCNVMGVILALNEPLSLVSLSTLFGTSLNVLEIIKPLGSLLDGVHDAYRPIYPLHTSFRDFLLDKGRSSSFHVEIQLQHSFLLGRSLLACMRDMLRFNICDLKDSRLFNAVVPNLTDQVNGAIPTHLSYSCQYWMDHLQHTNCTPELLGEVTAFFKNFYWLEAISLLSLSSPHLPIENALQTCIILQTWAKVRFKQND